MGKPIRYTGEGEWKFPVRLPEQLAQKVYGIITERGCTCAEITRAAIADYVDRVNRGQQAP